MKISMQAGESGTALRGILILSVVVDLVES